MAHKHRDLTGTTFGSWTVLSKEYINGLDLDEIIAKLQQRG